MEEKIMKNCRLFFLLMVGSLVVLSAACQANTDGANVANIKVDKVPPSRSIIDTEEITVPNCEGNIEIIQTLGSVKTIELTTEVDTVAVATDGSEYKIPESLKLQLEIEVENSYDQTFQNEMARLEDVSMDAAPEFETVYTIRWEQLDHEGEIFFSIGSQTYKANYLYQLIVPKLLSKEEIECDGILETVTVSPQPALTVTATSRLTPFAPTSYTLTLRTKTYLYNGPQMAYGSVDHRIRLKGEEFRVIAQNPAGDWFLVQASDRTQGWLYVVWVNIASDQELIPVTEDFPPAPTPTAKPTRKPPVSYP
jgi:hypothetical protein